MKVVIAGGGKTGQHITRELLKHSTNFDIDITVIDENSRTIQNIQNNFNVATINGNIIDTNIFQELSFKEADFFIACTSQDEINLLSCILPDDEKKIRKIAVLESTQYTHNIQGGYYHSSIDHIINPTVELSNEILQIAKFSSAVEVVNFFDNAVLLLGYIIKKQSHLVNVYLKDISLESELLIGCIRRKGISYIPDGNWQIQADDEVYFLTHDHQVEKLEKYIGFHETNNKKVIIFGKKNTVPVIIIQLLENNFTVVFVAQNDETKLYIEQYIQKNISSEQKKKQFSIVIGDIIDVSFQKQIGAADSYLMVCIDELETINFTAGLIAKYLGTTKIIAEITSSSLILPAQNIGIDSVISHRLAISRKIANLIYYGDFLTEYTTIASTAIEVFSVNIKNNCPVIGKTLSKIKMPRNSLVGMIKTKNGDIELPRGNTIINEGDNLIIFTHEENYLKLKHLFGMYLQRKN